MQTPSNHALIAELLARVAANPTVLNAPAESAPQLDGFLDHPLTVYQASVRVDADGQTTESAAELAARLAARSNSNLQSRTFDPAFARRLKQLLSNTATYNQENNNVWSSRLGAYDRDCCFIIPWEVTGRSTFVEISLVEGWVNIEGEEYGCYTLSRAGLQNLTGLLVSRGGRLSTGD